MFVALAVPWPRAVGSIEVSSILASALVGTPAAVVVEAVEMRPRHALLRPA